ncbi:MAG TPA: hypothetical protein VMO76_05665 [Candidatus Udaeobacter sp.]|nr:hypothetical protein [Candidatus Udaeobacter sp.]
MQGVSFQYGSKAKSKVRGAMLLLVASALFGASLAAQQPGPLTPPPRGAVASASMPQSAGAGPQEVSSHITNQPPAMPVEQIIQKFAEREEDFRKERDNFTYSQKVLMQELDEDGQPDGEFRLESDIIFTPGGKRIEHVTYAPQLTLKRIIMTQQDMDDIEHVQPFVLTSQELPKYDVKYVGREQIDEIGTYVFDVSPKKIEKGQRYFQGRVWVEDRDLQIVKTFGRAEGFKKKNEDSAFPRFETFRENIEGHYWFPTYTRADDVLHFKTNDVHIRMTVRYENYKRFGSTIKIGKATEVDPEKH